MAANSTDDGFSIPVIKEKATAVIIDLANKTETRVPVHSPEHEHVPAPGSSVGDPVTSSELEAAGYQARRTRFSQRMPCKCRPIFFSHSLAEQSLLRMLRQRLVAPVLVLCAQNRHPIWLDSCLVWIGFALPRDFLSIDMRQPLS